MAQGLTWSTSLLPLPPAHGRANESRRGVKNNRSHDFWCAAGGCYASVVYKKEASKVAPLGGMALIAGWLALL